MRAMVRVGVVLAALAVSVSPVWGVEPATQRDTRGPVTVAVTLLEAGAGDGAVRARVVLDTHSVGLDGITFDEAVALRTAAGAEVRPSSVEVTGSGHHREAIMVFAAPPGPILIVVKGVGGVGERTFTWERPAAR